MNASVDTNGKKKPVRLANHPLYWLGVAVILEFVFRGLGLPFALYAGWLLRHQNEPTNGKTSPVSIKGAWAGMTGGK